MSGILLSVNIAHVIPTPRLRAGEPRDTKPSRTGIDKRPADGAVRVEPLGLVAKGSVWYLVATVDGQSRTYRVSRVQEAAVTIGCRAGS